MKKIFTLLSLLGTITVINAQNTAINLCDFDSTKKVAFKDYDGILDTAFVNPMTTGANTSMKCARYIRKNVQFDNLKLYAHTKFVDISNFAQATTPSKISMMVMSKMPVGSKIDVQLGSRQDQSYPGGIHSIYTGTTTMVNQWELITFNLSTNLSSNGGFPYPGSIDKMVILFNTNATSSDTIYFDMVMGPAIEAAVGIQEYSKNGVRSDTYRLSQNVPNPAKDLTVINIDMNATAFVTMKVSDLLGKTVLVPVSQQLSVGKHAIELDLTKLPAGVYFYSVQNGDQLQTRKMIVSK